MILSGHGVAQAVMVVLEKKKKKEMTEWSDVRSEITSKIVEEAEAFDATAKSKKEKWVDGKKIVKGLDSEEVPRPPCDVTQDCQGTPRRNTATRGRRAKPSTRYEPMPPRPRPRALSTAASLLCLALVSSRRW